MIIYFIIFYLAGFLTSHYMNISFFNIKKEENKNSIFYKIKQTIKLWRKNK